MHALYPKLLRVRIFVQILQYKNALIINEDRPQIFPKKDNQALQR
jgi:hypothetical protein